MRDGFDWRMPVVLSIAFACRMIGIRATEFPANVPPPGGELAYYAEWARAFASGELYHGGPFLREPLYAWFLGSVMNVFGPSFEAVLCIQVALGVLSTWLVYSITRRAIHGPSGVIAALFFAVTPTFVYHDTIVNTSALTMPLVLLAIDRTLALRSQPSVVRFAVAGLMWGVACLCEHRAMFLAVTALAWIPSMRLDSRRASRLAWFAAAGLIPILAITAHNRLRAGQWVLLTTEAGSEFWSGNNDASTGAGTTTPWLRRRDWWEDHFEMLSFAETTTGLPRSESAVSRFYANQAWTWMLDNPSAAAENLLRKLRLSFSASALPRDHTCADLARNLTTWWNVPLALLIGLGGAGLVLVRLRGSGLLIALLSVNTVVTTAFVATSQSRLVTLALLAVFAGSCSHGVVTHLRERRWRTAILRLGLASGMAILSYVAPGIETPKARPHDWADRHDFRQPARIETRARQQLLRYPSSLLLRRALGIALLNQNELSRARHELQRVTRGNRFDTKAWSALADCCRKLGDLPAAATAAERLHGLNPKTSMWRK